MAITYVDIGGIAATRRPDEKLKTMALGSCIGIIAIAPKLGAVGLLHIALPDSTINLKKAAEKPGYFADTGIPELLRMMKRLGCTGPRDLIIKLAGGAQILDKNNTFNIGKRNLLATKKILWDFRLGPTAMDVGGTISRTVTVDPVTGIVTLSSPGRGEWQL
ncbi:MAG: chemotaxis protein CheD [Candidatus Wallbacteria bacterium HGW-Wallbacteria-1]|jgi:chemotaxis protein CheD|uniref:Probable chemoreceptor glutamine deamidase CheD n=1 Tax=Candidatus Wallbacteria bacterium HGW-Wallbacteria-1 TaxID=2013854 RepID=A0A2N1PJ43_9BACT|nr:MAG: chemotaxis protein CheD [Candidatus Wallbacteria bacterium HGW-Wallbacteria-1]